MTWVAVAIGGAAVIGAGASYAGAKKQSDASKGAANLQMQQWERNNAQQQPFIQSGYGAMGRLNTLLGINGNPYGRSQGGTMRPPTSTGGPGPGATYLPTPQGGITQRFGYSPQMQKGPDSMGVPANAPNFNLSRVLALRAAHGDTEAQRMLETMQS
jgi:hypothetical protein